MPELPLVAPWQTSSAASRTTTEAWVLESSRAIAAPMHPAPMIATSYVPSGFAAERAVAERRAGVPRCCEPPCTLNSLGQSASGTQ